MPDYNILCKDCVHGVVMEVQSTEWKQTSTLKFFCQVCQGYLNSMKLNFSNYDKPYPRVSKCSKYEKKEEKKGPIFESKHSDDYLIYG